MNAMEYAMKYFGDHDDINSLSEQQNSKAMKYHNDGKY